MNRQLAYAMLPNKLIYTKTNFFIHLVRNISIIFTSWGRILKFQNFFCHWKMIKKIYEINQHWIGMKYPMKYCPKKLINIKVYFFFLFGTSQYCLNKLIYIRALSQELFLECSFLWGMILCFQLHFSHLRLNGMCKTNIE